MEQRMRYRTKWDELITPVVEVNYNQEEYDRLSSSVDRTIEGYDELGFRHLFFHSEFGYVKITLKDEE